MLLREEQSVANLDSLELELNEAMALMERDFPCVIQDISLHLLHHIVEGIRVTGPVQGMWMFPFERFNSWIARRVTSRRYPEATVMETYCVSCIGNWNWGLCRWHQVLDFIITSVQEICSIQNWCNECLLLRFMSGAITWKYLGGCLMSSHIVLNVVEEVLFTYWFWADSRYTSSISLWFAYQRQPVLHYF